MRKANRINLSLLDDELRGLINASAKIFPITQDMVDNNLNPDNYEYGRIERHIYRWNGSAWEYIIADDPEVLWGDIIDKPSTFPPATHTHSELHTHTNKSVLDTITQALIDAWNTVTGKADKNYVDTELDKKSEVTHNHDTVYSQLGHTHDYSPSNHNHDDKYSQLGHTHNYSPSEHNHDLVYSKLGHDHDGAYYKKSEVDSKLTGKADKVHTHDYSPSDHNHDEIYLNKTHEENKIIHITQEEREDWNNKSPFKYEKEFLELRDHYGYMNIDGGAFDGGDGYYLMIDGGTF